MASKDPKTEQNTKLKSQLGLSYLVEYTGCEKDSINNQRLIKKLLIEATEIAGASFAHEFFQTNLSGITGIVLTTDSHFTIHTWPDLNYVGIEIFTSHPDLKIQRSIDYLGEALKAKQVSWQKHHRGPNSQPQPFRESHSISRDH